MIAIARAHGMTVMVGCMIESSIGITAAAHFTPLVDIVDLDGAALLADDPFVGATIDGGQVSLPSGRASACGGDDGALRHRRSAAPARLLVYLPHSRDTGRPGRPGGPRRRARAPAGDDRHRARDRRARARGRRPRDPRSTRRSPPCPRACWPRRWMAEYYGSPIGLTLRCMLPAGLWGESQVVAVRAPGRWKIGGVAGQVLAELEERGGEAPVPLLARVLKRPVWDAVHRLASVRAVSLRVEPPDTAGSTATERVVALRESRRPCSSAPPCSSDARRREALRGARVAGGAPTFATSWSSWASARR